MLTKKPDKPKIFARELNHTQQQVLGVASSSTGVNRKVLETISVALRTGEMELPVSPHLTA